MTAKNTKREQRKIQELARYYASQGFRVSVEPRGQAVPSFLRKLDFAPDLIAESDDESNVIEVSSRDTAERLRELSKVVETIEKRRGWKFILVMTNPRTPTPALATPGIPRLNDLQDSFDRVSTLAELSRESNNDFAHAVLLSAWAIVEGALRMYLYTGRTEMRARSPRSIVRDAVMFGFITPNEGHFLDSVAQLRNAVAHGAVDTKIPASTVNRLMSLCKSLVSETAPKKRDG
jgi:uncharacterized protein YutE (UPF0331/DUF86 family)